MMTAFPILVLVIMPAQHISFAFLLSSVESQRRGAPHMHFQFAHSAPHPRTNVSTPYVRPFLFTSH